MKVFDLILLVAAMLSGIASLCRMDSLQYRKHRLSIIVLHGALAIGCAFAALHAWVGSSDGSDVAIVVASIAWIVVSLKTWRHGVPAHFHTRPADLDQPLQLNEMEGRR